MLVARKLDLGRGWFWESGADTDVVILSRVRLGRNIDGVVFSESMSFEERGALASRFRRILHEHPAVFGRFPLNERISDSGALLRERFLLETASTNCPEIYVRDDQRCAVIPFEEDHLALWGFRSGRALRDCHEDMVSLAAEIESELPFAVSLRWGYLSPDPGAAGAVLRASALLHLPALIEAGDHDGAIADIVGEGYVRVESFRSSRTASLAEIVQVSSTPVFGADESRILVQLEEAIERLVHYEREARVELLRHRGEEVAEMVRRALGLLRHTPTVQAEEAMELLSWIRLGVALEITEEVTMEEATALLFVTQRSHVMREARVNEDENGLRAMVLKRQLASGG